MKSSLICLWVLATGPIFAADLSTWSRVDNALIEQTLQNLSEGADGGATVSTFNLISEGVEKGAPHQYTFTVMNKAATTSRVMIEFFTGSGNRAVFDSELGSTSANIISLPAGAEASLTLGDSFAALGWARVTTDQNEGLQAQVRWTSRNGEVSVKALKPGKTDVSLHVEAGSYLSLVNPSDTEAASVRLSAFGADGADACEVLFDLSPGEQAQGNFAKWLACGNIGSVGIETVSGQVTLEAYDFTKDKLAGVVPTYEHHDVGAVGKAPMAACAPSFSDTQSDILNAAGKQISLFVRASSSCAWSINAPAGFGVAPASGSGNRKVTIQVPSWPSAGGRQVDLQVGSSHFQVRQNGTACKFTLNADHLDFKSGDSSKAFMVMSNCHWEISSVAYWYKVNEKSGFGTKGAVVSVSATTRSRSDNLTVGDKTLTINQSK